MGKQDNLEYMEYVRDIAHDAEEILNRASVQSWADLGNAMPGHQTLAELMDDAGSALFYLKEELNKQIRKMEDELDGRS